MFAKSLLRHLAEAGSSNGLLDPATEGSQPWRRDPAVDGIRPWRGGEGQGANVTVGREVVVVGVGGVVGGGGCLRRRVRRGQLLDGAAAVDPELHRRCARRKDRSYDRR